MSYSYWNSSCILFLFAILQVLGAGLSSVSLWLPECWGTGRCSVQVCIKQGLVCSESCDSHVTTHTRTYIIDSTRHNVDWYWLHGWGELHTQLNSHFMPFRKFLFYSTKISLLIQTTFHLTKWTRLSANYIRMDNITVINCNLNCLMLYVTSVSKISFNAFHFCTVVIIDPGISNANGYQPFTDGNQMGVFIKVRHTYILAIIVLQLSCAFPSSKVFYPLHRTALVVRLLGKYGRVIRLFLTSLILMLQHIGRKKLAKQFSWPNE